MKNNITKSLLCYQMKNNMSGKRCYEKEFTYLCLGKNILKYLTQFKPLIPVFPTHSDWRLDTYYNYLK
jgi:hypothetical protein